MIRAREVDSYLYGLKFSENIVNTARIVSRRPFLAAETPRV